MLIILPISLLILLLTLLLPLLLVSSPEWEEEGDGEAPEEQDNVHPVRNPPLLLDNQGENETAGVLDERILLQVLVGEEVQEMTMAAYLQGVVAAEMPARFHPEALKAQAVAARTYTLHRMLVAPAARHPEAYVCGDYACCKAYHNRERLRERWGGNYSRYSEIIARAVAETDGLILSYEGLPILAAFHAASYGFTEASGAIWGEVPYLQSVRTFEGVQEVPGYYTTVKLTFAEFREIALTFPGVSLPEDKIPYWISNVTRTDSGRIASLNLGGAEVSGAEFRRLFSLRSTAVTFAFDGTHISLTTGGHGHGVGMSQFGANTLAEIGLEFNQILDWYYTGVTLIPVDSLFPPAG